jgi:hypothetical protein
MPVRADRIDENLIRVAYGYHIFTIWTDRAVIDGRAERDTVYEVEFRLSMR